MLQNTTLPRLLKQQISLSKVLFLLQSMLLYRRGRARENTSVILDKQSGKPELKGSLESGLNL